MYEKNFGFNLGDNVRIKASGEKGEVVGRSDHVGAGDQYNVRYKDGTGCAVEKWWAEDALEPA